MNKFNCCSKCLPVLLRIHKKTIKYFQDLQLYVSLIPFINIIHIIIENQIPQTFVQAITYRYRKEKTETGLSHQAQEIQKLLFTVQVQPSASRGLIKADQAVSIGNDQ